MEKLREEGILIDILSRVPVKTLLRCMCVSKQWYSLISDPDFAKLQLRTRKRQNPTSCRRLLWINDAFRSIDTESLSTPNQGTAVRVLDNPSDISLEEYGVDFLGSCDGLVCLLVEHTHFVLWNPTTGEYDHLPCSTLDYIEVTGSVYGFGYDSSIDDYKVVKCSPTDDGVDYTGAVTEILSCKSGSWRRIEGGFISPNSSNALFLNGYLHWLQLSEGDDSPSRPHSIIHSFNLADETFGRLQCPMPNDQPSISGRSLTIADECLCAYRITGTGSTSVTIEGWILRDYQVNSSWTKFFSCSAEVSPTNSLWSPVWFREDNKILLHTGPAELSVLDRDDGMADRLQIGEDTIFSSYGTYDESLVSPFL